jgi:putative oxidoreductase
MATSTGLAERIAFGRATDHDDTNVAPAVRPGTMLVARFLIAAIFIVSGSAKLVDIAGTAGHMAAQGIPAPETLAMVAGIAELAGGISLALGFLARIGAIGLTLFMILATLLFHDFWTFEGAEQRTQLIQFMKNLAIMGGLAMIVACGAGRYSVDGKLRWPNPP